MALTVQSCSAPESDSIISVFNVILMTGPIGDHNSPLFVRAKAVKQKNVPMMDGSMALKGYDISDGMGMAGENKSIKRWENTSVKRAKMSGLME